MSRLAIKMDEHGNIEDVQLPKNPLKVMQEAVEGYIEPVTLREDGLTMYVNEEGLYTMVGRHNRIATAFMAVSPYYGGQAFLNGPVIFTGGIDEEGDTTGLSQSQASYIINIVQAYKTLNGLTS